MSQDPEGTASEDQLPTPPRGLKLASVRPPADSFADDSSVFYPGAPPPSALHPLVGCTVDNRYRIEAVLGEGGMGVVFRCRHKIIDKKVAMKVLRADLARDAEVTERFLTEAKAASAIGDEHIIDISDFGLLPDGSTYFVMEFLDGQPLSKVIRGEQRAPISRLIHIARQLAQGLAAAHDAGIVHRDLKPDNIFLIPRGGDKDFVKILDFGIAKVSTSSEGSGQLTRAGAVFGTPHYMSPEQAAGAPVDHRGDIYSFGVILYEFASGKVPFDADNFMGILTQHMYKAPVPIRALVPPPENVPPGLEAIILKCLSKRPDQRYASTRELIAELDKLANGLAPDAVGEMMSRSGGFNVPTDFFKVHPRMPAPVPATPRGFGRSRWPLFAGGAGILVAVGLVVAIFARSSTSPASPSASNSGVPSPRASSAPLAVPAKAATPAAVWTSVAVAGEPPDAEIYRDGKSLGTSPVVIDIADGETVHVEVRRTGYVTRSVVLDGKESKLLVTLSREHVAPLQRPRTVTVRRAPSSGVSLGGGDIVNPWAK